MKGFVFGLDVGIWVFEKFLERGLIDCCDKLVWGRRKLREVDDKRGGFRVCLRIYWGGMILAGHF